MFESLNTFKEIEQESINTPEPVITPQVTPQVPVQPPVRFGSTRIILPPDPNNSVITIIEQQNDSNTNDYLVFISSCILSESIYYSELITLLRTLPSSSKVCIHISSPGGSLNTGAMIANAIKSSKATVYTHAIGIVASAAALVWSYGKIRSIADGSVIMFHMSSHGDVGNSRGIQVRAENIVRYVKEVAIDPLVEEGLLTPDEAEIIIDKRRDLWLDSAVINLRLEHINAKI